LTIEIIGKEEVCSRIKYALATLKTTA